jgi:hypothetical protein
MNCCFPHRCVSAPDKCVRPISIRTKNFIKDSRCRGSTDDFQIGFCSLGVFQISMRDLERPLLCRVKRKSTAERIKLWRIERPTVLVRLRAIERTRLELELIVSEPGGNNSVCDVRCVLPVMADRRVCVVHSRKPMQIHRRSERRFAGQSGIHEKRILLVDLIRVSRCKFADEIMWVLAIVIGSPRYSSPDWYRSGYP